MLTPQQVRDALRTVADPVSGADIVLSGMISGDILIKDGTVSFALEVAPELSVKAEPVRSEAERVIAKLDGVNRATVDSTGPAASRCIQLRVWGTP